MSMPAIRRRAVACPAAFTILLALGTAPAAAATRCVSSSASPASLGRDVGAGIALGSPFGGPMRSSATYAANFGAH